MVTQNQIKAGLTHRRAVFFVDKEFFVLVDEGYGDGNKDKINLNFHLCSSEANETVYDDLSASYQYGAHTTFANNNILVRTFAETNQNLANQMLHLMFTMSFQEKRMRHAKVINILYENLGMELPALLL